MNHEQYMRRALQLAALGRGKVSPNPMVGCVIVHDEKIIGEGYHQQYGGPHAEVNAVSAVKEQDLLKESSVYVTLEPCSHNGKTPPCADLLVKKGVKKVVVASGDPHEKVNGRGIKRLRDAGIEVIEGILEADSWSLNVRFNTFHQKRKPYVILKWAQTQDGFIARNNFDSKWISNQYSRQLVHKWRAEEDAILVGYNTALHDNPALNVRDWKGNDPIRVVLDREASLPDSHNLLNGKIPTMVFTKNEIETRENVQYVQSDMHPSSILDILVKQDISSVIIEGGSNTINQFVNAGLWDEARVFTSKTEFGEGIEAPKLNMNSSETLDVNGDKLEFFYHADR
jgi:diaminohydroxyphosphoribosylaminopyrimidine deaminase/5-amino-6-(5-phosphoribosylamino)uracil reductase